MRIRPAAPALLAACAVLMAAVAAPARGQVPAPVTVSPVPASSDPSAQQVAQQIERAARAYDQGNCGEVLAAFAAVPDAENALKLDGLSQYRWGFCLASSGRPGAEDKYRQAATALGFETGTPSARLEAHFYRVNALLNLKQRDEGQAAAKLAVERYRAGTLTVAADDPVAWFQLGKLFRDAGDANGALAPYRRALDAHDKGPKKLRSAYLERIADVALEQKDLELARRASGMLGQGAGDARAALGREARILLAGGDFEGAAAAFDKAGAGGGEAAMDAQYAAAIARRALEVRQWGGMPATALEDGRAVADLPLDDLRGALRQAAVDTFKLMDAGHTVEVPRKKGIGSRAAPNPEDAAALKTLQGRFTGLLLDAVRRQAPLQEWCVVDGYPPLVHNPWTTLYVQRAAQDREKQLIELTLEKP